jgi:outer membrane protein assembly factor BamD (BamD/ComL family)
MNKVVLTLILALLVCFNADLCAQGIQKKDTPPSFNEANTLIDEKLWDQAVIEWERLLELYPLNANYHYKIGMCMLQTDISCFIPRYSMVARWHASLYESVRK